MLAAIRQDKSRAINLKAKMHANDNGLPFFSPAIWSIIFQVLHFPGIIIFWSVIFCSCANSSPPSQRNNIIYFMPWSV